MTSHFDQDDQSSPDTEVQSLSKNSAPIEPFDKKSSKIVQPFNRVAAKFLDLFFILAISVVLSDRVSEWIGPLFGLLYSLYSDHLFKGQSLGKKIFKIKVVPFLKARPFTLKDSVIRNIPVGVVTLFAMVNFTGWILLVLIGFPLLMIEIYLILKAPNAQRLGDVMADTIVIHV